MDTTHKTLRWGIIGLGNIAHQFAKDLLLLDNCQLVAVASRNLDKAKSFATLYKVTTAYGNYTSLLEDKSVDIVYIATPHNSHLEWAVSALNQGKHVLCEKPLAVNAPQVMQIAEAAKREGLFLMEAFWSRFNPSIVKVLELVKNGAIGEVNYLNADFTFFRDDPKDSRMLNMDLAGGSLLDMGVYPCFLAYMLLGKPRQILASAIFHTTGADLQTAAILKFPSGIANIYSGFKSQSDMSAKIYGTKGRIYIDPIWHETQGFTLIKGNDGNYHEEHYNFPTLGKGFTYEIQECVACIQAGKTESEKWSLQHSLDLISITDEIRRQIGLVYPFES